MFNFAERYIFEYEFNIYNIINWKRKLIARNLDSLKFFLLKRHIISMAVLRLYKSILRNFRNWKEKLNWTMTNSIINSAVRMSCSVSHLLSYKGYV